MGHRQSVLLALLLVGTAFPWLAAQVADSSSSNVLVLRNGRVLVGRVCRMGDSYVVSLGADGEARLATGDVEMVCGSLDEAYFYKRDGLRGDDLQGRLELAEWCLRNRCSWRAADQLLAVYNVAPAHPRLAVLERRLFSTESETSAAERASTRTSSSPAAEPVATPALLPDGATVYFTQKVQPVLLNRCASNACHGTRSEQQFQLGRSLRGQPMSNRLTQKNLQAALSFVNARQPEESPLLSAPRQPHGGLPDPVFGVRESAQYDQLLAWVRLVANRRADPESVIAEAADPKPSPIVAGTANDSSPVEQASFSLPAPTELDTEKPPALGTDVLQRLPAATMVPDDPFDPEAFNREFASPPPEPAADQATKSP